MGPDPKSRCDTGGRGLPQEPYNGEWKAKDLHNLWKIAKTETPISVRDREEPYKGFPTTTKTYGSWGRLQQLNNPNTNGMEAERTRNLRKMTTSQTPISVRDGEVWDYSQNPKI